MIKGLISKYNTNFKTVGTPLRIALIGTRFGPALYQIILSLSKEKVIERLKAI